jgi:hypothetical protein
MASFTQSEYNAFLARQMRPVETRREGVTDEGKLHDEILNECRRRGWIAFHSRMDVPQTANVGTPDFVILADQGRAILIEAKSITGKLSTAQAAINAWASKLGHRVHVVRSLADFMEVL